MDQRGVADTQPELTCPEIDEFNTEAVGLPYDSPDQPRAARGGDKECHDRLVGQGIDLSAYNTSENSADFADLRKALKIKQWNVYGLSYGTDLALSLMRDHPEGIRSVIIDSVVPPSAATRDGPGPTSTKPSTTCFARVPLSPSAKKVRRSGCHIRKSGPAAAKPIR